MFNNLTKEAFVALVDHTLLKPEATRSHIETLCAEAIELQPASVCVNSYWTATVSGLLAGSKVDTCSVVGFPLGAVNLAALQAETTGAVTAGANEIDMVLPVGVFRSDQAEAGAYITTCRTATDDDTVLKVILETALLSAGEIAEASRLAVDAGADFVKTSTGFNPAGGATVEAVRIMRETVGPDIGVKASGGIRTLDDVRAMVEAGASRLGMSATTAIINQLS